MYEEVRSFKFTKKVVTNTRKYHFKTQVLLKQQHPSIHTHLQNFQEIIVQETELLLFNNLKSRFDFYGKLN